MTNDNRELLELAARAVGHLTRTDSQGVWLIEPDGSPIRLWRPHEDDGDALRLAVRLASITRGTTFSISLSVMHDGRGFSSAEFHARDGRSNNVTGDDLAQAAMLAIVRAASAIGKGMP
jgi:hypothetical protein